MFDRVLDLTLMGVGVTVWNVWDLPLWAWRGYAEHIDRERLRAEEASRGR